jgi:hypothetical protein
VLGPTFQSSINFPPIESSIGKAIEWDSSGFRHFAETVSFRIAPSGNIQGPRHPAINVNSPFLSHVLK